jgi:hypothetical protein
MGQDYHSGRGADVRRSACQGTRWQGGFGPIARSFVRLKGTERVGELLIENTLDLRLVL